RLVERVAETGVDVPHAIRVGVRWKVADREDEVVAHLVFARAPGAMHASDMTSHRVAERAKELAQCTVQVIAVPAPRLRGDARRGSPGIHGPTLTKEDPEGLVGHSLDMRAVEPEECLG